MEALVSSSHLYASQIKEYGHFLKDYDQKLSQLHLPETLSTGPVPSIVRLDYACGNEQLPVARMIESNSINSGKSSNAATATSNLPLNKILSTFGQLCREIDCLEQEIRTLVRAIYDRTEPLRNVAGDPDNPERPHLLWIAQNMDLMATVQCHYERLRDVGVLVLRQIGAFFDEEAAYGRGKRTKKNGLDGKALPSLEVDYLFDYIGKLLRITLGLDQMLWKTSLKAHWRRFAQKLRQPMKNGAPSNKAGYRDLLFVCQAMGFWIGDEAAPEVTGEKRLLEALYKVKTRFDPVCSGEAFSDRFVKFLKRKLSNLTAGLRNTTNGVDFTQSDGVIGVNMLLNFALYLFLPIEQRMLKNLFELNVKFPLIPLEDNFPWLPDEFIQQHGHKLLRDFDASAAPISVSTPLSTSFDYQRARDAQLQALEKSATPTVLCLHAASWLVEAHLHLRNRPPAPAPGTAPHEDGNFTLEKLRSKCGLLLEGIWLVREMEYVVGTLYALYGRRSTEKTDKLIQYRRLVVEFLLSSTRRAVTVPCLQFIVQHQQHKIYTIVNSAKKKLLREAKDSKSTAGGSLWLEKLATIDILEKCLHGPATPDRVGMAQLTIALCHGSAPTSGTPLLALSDDAYRKVESLLDRLATFIAWEQQCSRLDIAGKCTPLLSADSAFRSDALTGSIVPMSNRIEAFIRWDFHGKWHQIEPFDPFRDGTGDTAATSTTVADQNHTQKLVFAFLRTKLAQESGGRWFCARHSVAQHLSDVFYTLSTISPSEWRIYREMRTIVDRKYGIRLVEDQLPRTTAEDRRGPRGHGKDDDVLALMEDFEQFIGAYGYDLHGQLFIERQQAAAGGGLLNVVKIEHIANSIKRHGPGIISTVVNYAFQFLRQKLFTFSHFLYDEQIHSPLAADAKKLANEGGPSAGGTATTASVTTATYTYDRALAFNRRIRNLGLSDDGDTYVDLFRKLICQIGNAMAFIRMLHGGALHECTGAAEFVSNPPMAAEQSSEEDGAGPIAPQDDRSAVGIWRQDMATVRASWRLENEFFRLLINAFEGFRRRRTNPADGDADSAPVDSFAHLELFYLIIPPLTISYVEAMLKAKETIAKKDRHGTLLPTDDGFVMGLSYLLTLLNQTAAFNSLHWFKEVHTKYGREMAKLNQQTAGSNPLQSVAVTDPSDEKMLPTVSLTRKRLNAMQHEFELLQYNLSSSKIFFNFFLSRFFLFLLSSSLPLLLLLLLLLVLLSESSGELDRDRE
uniref:CYRIA/CYRIB Rac1 binding domain-containing protein n=1 Tax=Anopheles dirus TaxID=7168 RepID=A0A182N6V2_9DIPT